MRRLGADDIRVAKACQTLLPLVKVARQLLSRTSVAPSDLVRVVPGLEAWATDHNTSALAIVELVAAGAEAPAAVFTIVAGMNPGVTSRRVATVYRRWQATRTRRA